MAQSIIQYIVYVTIFFMPMYMVRFSLFDISLSVLDVGMIGVIVVGGFVLWRSGGFIEAIKQDLISRSKTAVLGGVLLFFGLFLGIVTNGASVEQWGVFVEWFVLPILCAFVMGLLISRGVLDIKNVILAYYMSAGVVAFIALIYFIMGETTYDGRLSAFYLSPNHLSMYIVPALVFGWFFIWRGFDGNLSEKYHQKRLLVQSVLFVLFASMVIALYFTYSYGGWISFLLGVFVGEFLVLRERRLKLFRRSILVFTAVAIIGTSVVVSQWNTDKMQDLVGLSERSSLASRIMIWKSAWHIGIDNWLYGIGPGNFQEKYLEYQKYYPPYLEWAVPGPHNVYLAFWLQAGLFGLFGFLLVIVGTAYSLFKSSFTYDLYNKKIRIILLVMILSILLHGIVDTPIWKNDLSLVFWMLLMMWRR